MKNLILLLLLTFAPLQAQELIADVVVDFEQVRGSNNTVFKNLEKSLKDFINTTEWTDVEYEVYERIQCSFVLIINSREGNRFQGSLQVQARRPVYNSTFYTPTLNLNDRNLDFTFQDFDEMIFNERKFSGKNLVDVVAFYIYYILGTDADSFSRLSGTKHFEICQNIANNAQGQGFSGWDVIDGPRTRSAFIADVLKPQNDFLRKISYEFHRNGLDLMSDKELQAKNNIANALMTLQNFRNNQFAQFYPLDIFFQTKTDEIGQIFSEGQKTTVNITQLKSLLSDLSPTNVATWEKMTQ